MTRLLLLRHLPHTEQGRVLVGRMPGVKLAPSSSDLLPPLIRRIAAEAPLAVHTSPLERAVATARPIAEALDLPLCTAPELNEVDYGAWTGRTFADLDPEPLWQRWNRFRSGTRPPGGESMLEVQVRAWTYALALRDAQPEATLLLVSHGDVIRALLLQALGMPLDMIFRLEVEPGSLCVLDLHAWSVRVLCDCAGSKLQA